jgi:hypothetical protein
VHLLAAEVAHGVSEEQVDSDEAEEMAQVTAVVDARSYHPHVVSNQ